MTVELSNQEKFAIVNQHIKNCVTNIYNLNVTLIAENAVDSPNEILIANLNAQVNNEIKRQIALEQELSLITVDWA